MRKLFQLLFLSTLVLGLQHTHSFAQQRLDLDQADILEVIMGAGADTTIAVGNVRFRTQGGVIECDSATWVRGLSIRLIGNASIDNDRYRVDADTILYDLRTEKAIARGSNVRLWAKQDSLYAVGPEVLMEDNQRRVTLTGRPTVRLNYPDSLRVVTIIADKVTYDRARREADAIGNVVISRQGAISRSQRAELFSQDEIVELSGKPVLEQRDSRLTGEKIVLKSVGGVLQDINVYDSATADLSQRDAADSTKADSSRLSSDQLYVNFQDGKPFFVRALGQAYAWLHPKSTRPDVREVNETSGDSLSMQFRSGDLDHVSVYSGAQGEYRTTRLVMAIDSLTVDSTSGAPQRDSTVVIVTDTIRYQADQIDYAVADSLITLNRAAIVESDGVNLSAHQIEFETNKRNVRAYSGAIVDSGKIEKADDSLVTADLQPADIPVKLTDKDQQLSGDYLEYSLDSKRGRMTTSKSNYETGLFYGERLYREEENVFYLDDGRYTTCNADEPHFHFYSAHLKLKDQKRLVARPVVLYLGRIPLLAVPYWVFPLERGRRSGILPFTLGNIESGDRFIRNVGYYWAASEYLDVLGALDYYERNRTLNFYTKVNYAQRYVLNGSIDANYSIVTSYDRAVAEERNTTRWTLKGTHSQQLSPSLRFSASGQAVSDRSYYTDFSTDLGERLNRTLSSRANVQWQISRSVSLAGDLSLDNNLDTEAKSGRLPGVSLSLPTLYPFGTGTVASKNPLAGTTVTIRPSAVHQYSESPVVKIAAPSDTSRYLERRQSARLDYLVSVNRSSKLFKYVTINPSLTYNESEVQVIRTNGSDSAGLQADRLYRFYSYSAGVSANTRLYGTVGVPTNPLGIVAIPHTVSPSVTYGFTPNIDRFPSIRAFVGGVPGSSSRSQSLSFGLNQSVQARVLATEPSGSGAFQDTLSTTAARRDSSFRVLDLVSINSSFSYNLEATTRPWSNVSTSASSSLIRGLTFSASFVHSLYRPGTDELSFFSPYLTDYSVDLSTRFSGRGFLFDDTPVSTTDSLASGRARPGDPRWNLSLSYSYRESGRHTNSTKSSFLRLGFDFLLTPTTAVTYDHYYDISREKTVNNQVQITKGLTDCWTGNIYWIPTGSNAGYGFRIFANALPFLKLDNSQTPLSSGTFFNQR